MDSGLRLQIPGNRRYFLVSQIHQIFPSHCAAGDIINRNIISAKISGNIINHNRRNTSFNSTDNLFAIFNNVRKNNAADTISIQIVVSIGNMKNEVLF